jgi:hypothetical protein
MRVTKEKVVFAASLLVALSSSTRIHKPHVEAVPPVPAEEPPRIPRVTVAIPPLHPEKPLDAGARDPFVPASAWIAATPASLGLPPALPLPRALPGGAPPGMHGPPVILREEPKPVEENDGTPPDDKEKDK